MLIGQLIVNCYHLQRKERQKDEHQTCPNAGNNFVPGMQVSWGCFLKCIPQGFLGHFLRQAL